MTFRILIAEDHTIVREGLRALLLAQPDLEIVAEVDNGRDLVEAAASAAPDLVLMDITMPVMSGVEAIREMRRRCPSIRVLVLTVHANEEYIHACIREGANGYIVKDATRPELMSAIGNVLNGKSHFCSEATERIISWYLHGGVNASPASSWDLLTHRERQTLKLIAEGKTNKQIAGVLDISTKTVEKHRANLMSKLKLHSTAALTAFAVRRGLLEQSALSLCVAAVCLAL